MQVAAPDTAQSIGSDTVVAFFADSSAVFLAEDTVIPEPVASVKSLFEGHLLQDSNDLIFVEKMDPGNGFAFGILLLCAAIVVYLQSNSEGVFSSVFRASFDRNQAMQDARVENAQRARGLALLQFIAGISIALFLAGALGRLVKTDLPLSGMFVSMIGVLLGFALIKRAVLGLLSLVFELHTELRAHRFNISVLRAASGLLLLPLTLLLFYSPQIPSKAVIYLGFGIIVFFYMKGIQRGFSIAVQSPGISVLHLFYYFCALEILPAFVLIRMAQDMW